MLTATNHPSTPLSPFYSMVVNEYYDFVDTTFAPGDATFARPAAPACTPTGFAATPREASRLLAAARPALARLPLTELFIAAMDARRR